MRICLVSSNLGPSLERLGHEVLTFPEKELTPIFDIQVALHKRDFKPDLLFQSEALGQRILLKGLGTLPCRKIFWSIDTHLNLFWHLYYLRLFDGVATPHVSLLERLRTPLPPILRLARHGWELPWRGFSARARDIGFVGRISKERPLRGWLIDFLQTRYNTDIASNLSFKEMLAFYRDTRLAPNESILGEVNFRLMETASCGCLPFSPDLGADQDALFEKGREIQTYSNILELESLLDHFLARPELAERKARLCWERVQREHLPTHRAQALLGFATELPQRPLSKKEGPTAFWLTVWNLHRAGRFPITQTALGDALELLPPTAECFCARLSFLVYYKQLSKALSRAAALLQNGDYADDTEANLACSATCLLAGNFDLARQFWYRQCKSMHMEAARPESELELMLLWSQTLQREGALAIPGVSYDPTRHLPTSALECLYLGQHFTPDNLELTRQFDALFARIPGLSYYRLGTLSELSLHNRGNWRYALSLGMTNLQAFRPRQGLDEVALAWDLADKQGKENAFLRALQGIDPKGLILAAIRSLAAERTNNTPEHS